MLDVLRDRMQRAYRKAGSMMLVSSVTTAICFFSNAFGILVVIQEFGIFMG
jgi:predicted RND superfamily exporter protein